MSLTLEETAAPFVDRRKNVPTETPVRERRQFTNSYSELSKEGRELAGAIDSYKATHRRRFINYDEMVSIIQSIGYRK